MEEGGLNLILQKEGDALGRFRDLPKVGGSVSPLNCWLHIMLQLYNSYYLVLYWKLNHITNIIYFEQHQLVMMEFSLKYITMILYVYIS